MPTRLVTLMLAALLAAGLISSTSIATAGEYGSAAKAKKCKKGYKRVGKKCKKKKKAPKPGTAIPQKVVTGGSLSSVSHPSDTKVIVKGTLNFSQKPAQGYVTAIVNIQITGTTEGRAATINVKIPGGSLSESFTATSEVPAYSGGATAFMTVGGTDSNTVTVN